MFVEEETSGESKGSLTNRLKVLKILLRIARKNEIKAKFHKVNAERILKVNKMTKFFYTPVKMTISPKLRINDVILYDDIITDFIYKTNRETKEIKDVDLKIKFVRNFKKGIGPLEDIIANNRETNAFPMVDGLPDRDSVINYLEANPLSEDQINYYKKEFGILKITNDLIYDILMIKYYSDVLFEEKLNETEIAEFVFLRIDSEKYMDVLNELSLSEELISTELDEENPNYDYEREKRLNDKITFEKKQVETLEKMLSIQTQAIAKMFKEINDYTERTIVNTKLVGFSNSIRDLLGIGLGILTLPLSRNNTFALGTNLIRNSVTNIRKNVKFEQQEQKVYDYKVNEEDLKIAGSSVKTASFLLDDTTSQLQDIKFKLNYYKDSISNYMVLIRQVELLEKGLAAKREKVRVLEETLEKSKVKVLKHPQPKL